MARQRLQRSTDHTLQAPENLITLANYFNNPLVSVPVGKVLSIVVEISGARFTHYTQHREVRCGQ